MLASYLARALGIATKEGNAGVSKPAEGSGKSGGLPRQSAANVGDAVARSMVRTQERLRDPRISPERREKLLAEEAILKRVHLTALKALATSTLLLSGLVALAACALHMNGIRTTEDIGACLRSRGDAVRASLGMGTRVAEVDVVLPHRPTKKKLSELSDVLR
mmetsp:Transcript_9398/g.34470  ORF Transcript_9398/g.34470 Transcript_9398/m.34470 type:complete len:163 (+) Transcript_9398:162-650(+)